MPISDSVDFHIVEDDLKGKGLFASRRFEIGESIYPFDYWSEEETPMHVTNHSCDPNSSFNEHGQLIALKVIEMDVEITFNYLLHPIPASPWNFQCHCHSENCVDWISVSRE